MAQQGGIVEGAGKGRFSVYRMVEVDSDGNETLVGYIVLGPGTRGGIKFSINELGAATAKAIELHDDYVRPKPPGE